MLQTNGRYISGNKLSFLYQTEPSSSLLLYSCTFTIRHQAVEVTDRIVDSHPYIPTCLHVHMSTCPHVHTDRAALSLLDRTVLLTTVQCNTGEYSMGPNSPAQCAIQYRTIQYRTLHYTTLHYTSLHFTTLHYTTLHYTTLHYTTLHYTTLHHNTL